MKKALPWIVIEDYCIKTGLDKYLVGAIIVQESAANPYAIRFEPNYKYRFDVDVHARLNGISKATEDMLQASSIGLMQTMGCLARELGYKDNLLRLTVPENSLYVGCKYLKRLKFKYPNLNEMIASYNSGSPRYDSNKRLINQSYVDGVLKHMKELKND